jgi:hypothetical protein
MLDNLERFAVMPRHAFNATHPNSLARQIKQVKEMNPASGDLPGMAIVQGIGFMLWLP